MDTSRASRVSRTLGLPGEKSLLPLLAADCKYHGNARADEACPASGDLSGVFDSSGGLFCLSGMTSRVSGDAGVSCRIVNACGVVSGSCCMHTNSESEEAHRHDNRERADLLTFCCSISGRELCARVRARTGVGDRPKRSLDFEGSLALPSSRSANVTVGALSGDLISSPAGLAGRLPSLSTFSSWSGAGRCALGVGVRPRLEGLSSELQRGLNIAPVNGPCLGGPLRGGK